MINNNLVIQKNNCKQELLDANPQQRKQLLIEQISNQVAKILGISNLNDLDRELGFTELGLDSLGSVELRNKLQTNYDLKLSASVTYNYPNVKEIANYLESILFVEEKVNLEYNINNQSEINNIKTLSETEAEAMLLAELDDLDLEDI